MVSGKGGVTSVGAGASVYGFVGRWVPAGLVGWMMGMRRVGVQDGIPRLFKGLIENSEGPSTTSPAPAASPVDLDGSYIQEFPEEVTGDT